MLITQILAAPPVTEGGSGNDRYTVVHHDGTWYFVDYAGGSMPAVYECSGESEAYSRFDEADSGNHRPGCNCPDCFDPAAERRRYVPARSREWQ